MECGMEYEMEKKQKALRTMLWVFLDWSLSFSPELIPCIPLRWDPVLYAFSVALSWITFPIYLDFKFFHSATDMLCTISTEKGHLYKPIKLDILFHKVCETAHQFFRKWCKKLNLWASMDSYLSCLFFLLNSFCVTFFHFIHSFMGL